MSEGQTGSQRSFAPKNNYRYHYQKERLPNIYLLSYIVSPNVQIMDPEQKKPHVISYRQVWFAKNALGVQMNIWRTLPLSPGVSLAYHVYCRNQNLENGPPPLLPVRFSIRHGCCLDFCKCCAVNLHTANSNFLFIHYTARVDKSSGKKLGDRKNVPVVLFILSRQI